MENVNVQMSAEELKAFQEFKAQRDATLARVKRAETFNAYTELVDAEIQRSIKILMDASAVLQKAKEDVFNGFSAAIEMKEKELNAVAAMQRSHTFTSSDGRYKIKMGYHVVDEWADTANDGIELIKVSLLGLATDDKSKMLVDEVLKLVSKDSKGNLDKRKVLQLSSMEGKIGNEKFTQGLELIQKSYRMARSKRFLQAFVREDVENEWECVPLNITNVDLRKREGKEVEK